MAQIIANFFVVVGVFTGALSVALAVMCFYGWIDERREFKLTTGDK